jgi:hypothetical protein
MAIMTSQVMTSRSLICLLENQNGGKKYVIPNNLHKSFPLVINHVRIMQRRGDGLKYVWLPIFVFIFCKYQKNYDSNQKKKMSLTDLRILIICLMNVYLPRKNVPLQKNPKNMISRFYFITN